MSAASCLYDCRVMHQRLSPFANRFLYRLFMFYLNLDEIDTVAARIPWISHNRFNLFNFREADHVHYGPGTLKQAVIGYAREQGCRAEISRVMLLTHLRVLGHVFNPVSFYFCFDAQDKAVAVVTEVGNTFREMKPYFLGSQTWNGQRFESSQAKYFYVSPFIAHDAEFRFKLAVPGETLSLAIDDARDGNLFFVSALTGERQALTSTAVLGFALRFPLMTVQVLGLIHWRALQMWLRRIPYFRKTEYSDLQRGYQNVPHQ